MTRLHLVLQDPSKIQQKAMQSMFDCFEGLCEGTLIVDKHARVVWINERYAARLNVEFSPKSQLLNALDCVTGCCPLSMLEVVC